MNRRTGTKSMDVADDADKLDLPGVASRLDQRRESTFASLMFDREGPRIRAKDLLHIPLVKPANTPPPQKPSSGSGDDGGSVPSDRRRQPRGPATGRRKKSPHHQRSKSKQQQNSSSSETITDFMEPRVIVTGPDDGSGDAPVQSGHVSGVRRHSTFAAGATSSSSTPSAAEADRQEAGGDGGPGEGGGGRRMSIRRHSTFVGTDARIHPHQLQQLQHLHQLQQEHLRRAQQQQLQQLQQQHQMERACHHHQETPKKKVLVLFLKECEMHLLPSPA